MTTLLKITADVWLKVPETNPEAVLESFSD